jgi:Fic family protein
MAQLVDFISADSPMNDLVKAAVIHFYVAYLHPYFDGNGRMARLLHLWDLVQSGYPSTLFVSFSSLIERSRHGYYQAYTLCEENAKLSGVLDATPFISYFVQNIYDRLDDQFPARQTTDQLRATLAAGKATEKEHQLWNYVLSAYGTEPFSTKQLERDFGNAAYATIRGFVQKFEELELLSSQKYGNRVKYRVR